MYRIILNGCIESENPDEILNQLTKDIKEKNGALVGNWKIELLPPYIDYQECEVS